MYFFVLFLCPCMHHNYGGISDCHACKDCEWPVIFDEDLYKSCPGDRVLVAMTHQVQCNQHRRPKVFNSGALRFFRAEWMFVDGVLNAKTPFICGISDFNLGVGLELCLGVLYPRKSPSGDWTECNIPKFEAVLSKNIFLFTERCRRSNNLGKRLPALTQSDCLHFSIFCEHYNRILLSDWVLGHCNHCWFGDVHITMHSYSTWAWPV